MDDNHEPVKRVLTQIERRLIGTAVLATWALTRGWYRKRYVKITDVNRRLEDLFEKGLLRNNDGNSIIPQFFKK